MAEDSADVAENNQVEEGQEQQAPRPSIWGTIFQFFLMYVIMSQVMNYFFHSPKPEGGGTTSASKGNYQNFMLLGDPFVRIIVGFDDLSA